MSLQPRVYEFVGVAVLCGTLVFQAPPACADEDFRTLTVPYSGSGAESVGSGIDVDLVNQARFTCLEFQQTELRWLDSSGAISTDATVELVSNYASLAKTLNLEVDYKSKADVSFAKLKAGAEMNLNIKYEGFAKDESRSLALVFKAQSDYGRQGLQPYRLQQPFTDLVSAGDHDGFRRRCGTHTIVAVQRKSSVAVVLEISELTASAKKSIETLYKTAVSASGPIKAVDVSASTDKSVGLKSLIESASKVGSLRVQFESRGGMGISDAMKASIVANPANVEQILTNVSQIAGSFTQESSAPVQYVLVPNTVFGTTTKASDISKLEVLNTYYLQLSRIDYALSRVGSYKRSFAEVYSKFYTAPVGALKATRKQLIAAIERCVLEDKCEYKMPEDLAVLYLEDVLQPDKLVMECSYKHFQVLGPNGQPNDTAVLTAISVTLAGKVRLADYVGMRSATLSRFGPDSKSIGILPGFASLSLSATDEAGMARIVATLDHKNTKTEAKMDAGTVVVSNLAEVTAMRDLLQNSIYGVGVQAKNGLSIMNTVGPPYGGDCPVIRRK